MDPIFDIPQVNSTTPRINQVHGSNVNGIVVSPNGIRMVGTINNQSAFVRSNTIANVNTKNIRDSEIPETRTWITDPPQAIPLEVPVTVEAGTPIVNMPGCVKVHKENVKKDPSRNKNLVNDDPKQNVVLCDSGMPYYEPPEYDYRELTWQTITTEEEEAEGLNTEKPEPEIKTETPEPPKTPIKTASEVECPPPNARRIGDLSQSGKERVTGYKLSVDKLTCITEWEDVPFIDEYLPSIGVVTTTAGIAAVATTSALLAKPIADLLLKVIKPIVKKTIAKIKEKLGKKPPTLSLNERKIKQREANEGIKAARKLKGR